MSIEDTCPGAAPSAPAEPSFVPPCCECEDCGDCHFGPETTMTFTWNVSGHEDCSPYPSGSMELEFFGNVGGFYTWLYREWLEPTGEVGVEKIVQVTYECATNTWRALVGRDTVVNQVELWHFIANNACTGTCAGVTMDLEPGVHCSTFVPGATGTATISSNATETTCQPSGCCSGSLTVTITGFMDGIDGSADCIECTDLNDVIVVPNTGDCEWSVGDTDDGITIRVDKGDWLLNYYTSKCGGGGMSWRAPRSGLCPPATGWTCFGATIEIMEGCDINSSPTAAPAVTVS